MYGDTDGNWLRATPEGSMMHAMGGSDDGANAGYPVGTRDEFLTFYRLAVGPVYRAASRLVGGDRQRSDDLVQEAFMDLVRQVRSGKLTSVDVGWVIIAVRHRYIDSMRRREREDLRLRLVWSQQLSARSTAAVELSDESATRLLRELPDAQRVAVVLHHVDGFSINEVAAALNRSVHATESLIARGRDRLRRLLQEDPDGY